MHGRKKRKIENIILTTKESFSKSLMNRYHRVVYRTLSHLEEKEQATYTNYFVPYTELSLFLKKSLILDKEIPTPMIFLALLLAQPSNFEMLISADQSWALGEHKMSGGSKNFLTFLADNLKCYDSSGFSNLGDNLTYVFNAYGKKSAKILGENPHVLKKILEKEYKQSRSTRSLTLIQSHLDKIFLLFLKNSSPIVLNKNTISHYTNILLDHFDRCLPPEATLWLVSHSPLVSRTLMIKYLSSLNNSEDYITDHQSKNNSLFTALLNKIDFFLDEACFKHVLNLSSTIAKELFFSRCLALVEWRSFQNALKDECEKYSHPVFRHRIKNNCDNLVICLRNNPHLDFSDMLTPTWQYLATFSAQNHLFELFLLLHEKQAVNVHEAQPPFGQSLLDIINFPYLKSTYPERSKKLAESYARTRELNTFRQCKSHQVAFELFLIGALNYKNLIPVQALVDSKIEEFNQAFTLRSGHALTTDAFSFNVFDYIKLNPSQYIENHMNKKRLVFKTKMTEFLIKSTQSNFPLVLCSLISDYLIGDSTNNEETTLEIKIRLFIKLVTGVINFLDSKEPPTYTSGMAPFGVSSSNQIQIHLLNTKKALKELSSEAKWDSYQPLSTAFYSLSGVITSFVPEIKLFSSVEAVETTDRFFREKDHAKFHLFSRSGSNSLAPSSVPTSALSPFP